MENIDDNLENMIVSYVEKRMETKRIPYRAMALRKVESIREQLGMDKKIKGLTCEYLEKAENPTLIGWERYCRTNSAAKKVG